ncbi:MAG: hypothetical protein AB1420_15600 [Bacillota bacterium]
MKIGVVGPEDSVNQAVQISKDLNVEIVPLVYKEYADIKPLIYKHSSQKLSLPAKYVPRDNTTLVRVLFDLHYHHSLDITRFSIDLFTLIILKMLSKSTPSMSFKE